jgi:ERCC4-related helicase
MISNIELRSEDCLDIQRYTHKRIEEKFVVKLGPELTQLKDKFLKVIDTLIHHQFILKVINLFNINISDNFIEYKTSCF